MGDPVERFLSGDLAGAVAVAPPDHPLSAVARGAWAEALEAARGDDPLSRWCRATARLGLGDRAGALADWTRVVEAAPGSPVARKDRAVLRALLGDREGALTDLAAAAALDPSDVVPRLWAAGLSEGRARTEAGATLAPFARSPGWSGRLAALVLGEVPVEALLAQLEAEPLAEGDRQRRRCQLHGYAGLLAERDGDLGAARGHYEACAATAVWTYLTHLWARERLVDQALRAERPW